MYNSIGLVNNSYDHVLALADKFVAVIQLEITDFVILTDCSPPEIAVGVCISQ